MIGLSNLDEFPKNQLKEKMLAYAFHKPGLPLDRNIHRMLGRIYKSDVPNLDALRDELKKCISVVCPQKALIDIHEILRLHGMAVCGRRPKCELCMVGHCSSRIPNLKYCGFPAYALKEAKVVMRVWEKWRELICDPAEALSKSSEATVDA